MRLQRRACRTDVLTLVRNAHALTASAARIVAELAPTDAELLELDVHGHELYILNPVRVLDRAPSAGGPAVYRIAGSELDCTCFSPQLATQLERLQRTAFDDFSPTFPIRTDVIDLPAELGRRTLTACKAPASLARVREAEARLGHKFPDSLAWLFTHANGATFSDALAGLSSLSELKDGATSAEWFFQLQILQFRLLPWHLFPVAEDGYGDTYFVDTRTESGTLYLALHDTAHERLIPVLQSLDELVASLDLPA